MGFATSGKAKPSGTLGDEEVYLRDMFNFHKKSDDDNIKRYKDRVVVTLNDKTMTYYTNDGVHGNRGGAKNIVNAVDFGIYFGLQKTVSDSDKTSYRFSIGSSDNRGSATGLFSTMVFWDFSVYYIETPDKKIVYRQSLLVDTYGWSADKRIIDSPSLIVGTDLPLAKGSFILPDYALGRDRRGHYYSDERIVFEKNQPVTLEANITVMHNQAMPNIFHPIINTKHLSITF